MVYLSYKFYKKKLGFDGKSILAHQVLDTQVGNLGKTFVRVVGISKRVLMGLISVIRDLGETSKILFFPECMSSLTTKKYVCIFD